MPDPVSARPDAGRYALSLRKTGLGDRLVCLCAAWRFARLSARTLVVDWRHARYAPGAGNLFTHCFEAGPTLAGVPLLTGDELDTADLPRPAYPPAWEQPGMLAMPWLMPTDSYPEERDKAVAAILVGEDFPAATVAFHACLSSEHFPFADAHACLAALRPLPAIAAAVEDFRRTQLPQAPVIGLHMRHGNGGDIMGHAPSWHSFDAALQRCRRAVEAARARLGHEAPVLLCTDSVEVETAFRAQVPGVICRPKTYRPPAAGELHAPGAAAAGFEDALVEMLLLARCDALIRYPAGSFFSFYAAITQARPGAAPATVGALQQPFDRADPLSPALLV
ncbi:nodulation protein NodZ [Labrys neptuniae]